MKLQHRRLRRAAGDGDILAARPTLASTRPAMASSDSPLRSCVIPAMHYRDAPAAIEWLSRVLGFE
jgi:hypothetical protein